MMKHKPMLLGMSFAAAAACGTPEQTMTSSGNDNNESIAKVSQELHFGNTVGNNAHFGHYTLHYPAQFQPPAGYGDRPHRTTS